MFSSCANTHESNESLVTKASAELGEIQFSFHPSSIIIHVLHNYKLFKMLHWLIRLLTKYWEIL